MQGDAKGNTKHIHLKLDLEKDEDILDWYSTQYDKQGAVKHMLRVGIEHTAERDADYDAFVKKLFADWKVKKPDHK